jgi:hypothetical protein
MVNPGIRSLFHTLVVVGASVSACGGKSETRGPEGELAGAGGIGGVGPSSGGMAPTAAGSASVGAAGATSGGGAGMPGVSGAAGMPGVSGAAGMPFSAFDCASPSQWKCVNYTTKEGCHCDPSLPKAPSDCASPFAFTCDGDTYAVDAPYGIGCSCQDNALTPTDCEHPEQFQCSHYGIYFTGCVCDPDAPLSATECEDIWCTEFSCASEAPRYGCECVHLGCIK